MAERGRGCRGGRGGGRREDPLDDEGLHQRDLRDVKNDDLRRKVRALRRRIARLEASRDSNFVVHYEDVDKNDNPFARAGGERHFRGGISECDLKFLNLPVKYYPLSKLRVLRCMMNIPTRTWSPNLRLFWKPR
ncbi:hypothetical protein CASFOL_027226 [Castilleja foliolosa]|uniref:Uncharacterized protein n=1 Tax=Castilleja foliolosa TaxID=1961234 RepID=A0ABD3CHD0_9LAMI